MVCGRLWLFVVVACFSYKYGESSKAQSITEDVDVVKME